MLAMRGDAWTARFRAQTFTLFPRIRVYINKETRVAKFPALSRVIKFKHRAQGRGDGFCRGGGKRRVVVGQPRNEKARPARCVCTRGVPNESNSPVMFLRVMKRENNVIQAKACLYYIVGRMQGKLHLSTLRISSLSRFDSTILQTLYLNDIKFSPIGTLRR